MKRYILFFILPIVFFAVAFVSPRVRAETDTPSVYEMAEKYMDIIESGKKETLSDFLTNGEVSKNEADANSELDFSAEIENFTEHIPSEVADKLPNIESLESGGTVNTDEISLDMILDGVTTITGDSAIEAAKKLPRFIVIIAVAFILNNVVTLYDSRLSDVASLTVCTVIALQFFSSGIIDINGLSTYLSNLTSCATSLVSLLVTVLISGGNINTASLASASVSIICILIEYLFSKVVLPLISMSLALSVAGSTGLSDLAKYLAGFMRKTAVWIVVITATLATFVLALQSVLARSADTVGIKTVKFALGSFVPIVGGALSETVNTVSAGLSYIKNTCGAVGIVVLLLIVLPPVISLISAKVILFLASGFASLSGCKMEAQMLKALSGSADSLLALFICSGASFTIFIIGIISCNLAIG